MGLLDPEYTNTTAGGGFDWNNLVNSLGSALETGITARAEYELERLSGDGDPQQLYQTQGLGEPTTTSGRPVTAVDNIGQYLTPQNLAIGGAVIIGAIVLIKVL